jgi:2-polyprenyl-3-methyl-5-hydroxy-6-metoxy-1,4-benzoquinol methylase
VPGTLIDIGCGDGLFLTLLKSRHPSMRIIGIEHDRSKVAVSRVSIMASGVEIYSWDELEDRTLPLADYVTPTDILYKVAVKDWDGTFRLAQKQRKPGGTLVVKDAIDRPRWKTWLTFVQEVVAPRVPRCTPKATCPTCIRWIRTCNASSVTVLCALPRPY